MVISDPALELTALVCDLGDPAPCAAPPAVQYRAELIRRRFGLSLPPPFAGEPGYAPAPVRPATPLDAPAIAAVRWRAFGTSYRGILDDAFLDAREIVPPVSYWIGRAMVPPSRRHRLLVWGRPGEVHGHIEIGPVPGGGQVDGGGSAGEVLELYVDPCRQGRGGGTLLLAEAEDAMRAVGFDRGVLGVIEANAAARGFYESRGWRATGEVESFDLGAVAYVENIYERRL